MSTMADIENKTWVTGELPRGVLNDPFWVRLSQSEPSDAQPVASADQPTAALRLLLTGR